MYDASSVDNQDFIVLTATPTSLANSEIFNILPILPAHSLRNIWNVCRSFILRMSLTSRSMYVFIYEGYRYLGILRSA